MIPTLKIPVQSYQREESPKAPVKDIASLAMSSIFYPTSKKMSEACDASQRGIAVNTFVPVS